MNINLSTLLAFYGPDRQHHRKWTPMRALCVVALERKVHTYLHDVPPTNTSPVNAMQRSPAPIFSPLMHYVASCHRLMSGIQRRPTEGLPPPPSPPGRLTFGVRAWHIAHSRLVGHSVTPSCCHTPRTDSPLIVTA